MQTKRTKLATGILAGMILATVARAHPGHTPADLAAEISQPFAGPDHFIAFVLLTSILLVAFRKALAVRRNRQSGNEI